MDNTPLEENQERKKFHAPWEKIFDKMLTPFEEFIHRQTSSSLILVIATLGALVFANSPGAKTYTHLLHIPFEIHLGSWILGKSLQHWINDGLMAFFFFLVGMELKREVLVGELAEWRQALLPIVAAVGGMVVPALFYFSFNTHGETSQGWAIPMATDIVFALSVLTLLGKRVPKSLFTFLVAVAIVDDLGAILVIAIFYTKDIHLQALVAAGGLTVLLVVLNRVGIRRIFPYFLLGSLLWLALLKSGVHATLAGVITAFCIPATPKYSPSLFSSKIKNLIQRFDSHAASGVSLIRNTNMRGVVQSLENCVHRVETPLQRLEHSMHIPVAFLIIPIFAFFNAGVPFSLSSIGGVVHNPITLGVISGLIFGKFIGVSGACWIALKLRLTELPSQVRFGQIAGVALLTGIGFTMSIFIAELSFATNAHSLLMAKTGILLASLTAGVIGYVWLYLLGNPNEK